MLSLESAIGAENTVRLIDAFADHLDLKRLGFAVRDLNEQGRPAFDSRVFVKLYFYGYMNGLRSSRALEKECQRNIEVQWLIGRLTPNYHTIADFRKDNPKALRHTFRLFVSFLKDAELIEGKTIAIDGTKVRAHNGKKNNFNPKKIERHLKYIDEKTNEYLGMLDEMDRKEQPDKVKDIQEKIQRLKSNKIKYEALGDYMEDNQEVQVSTTDPDSRALLVQGQVVEICYNTQTAVDEKHKLIVATHTINRNDRNAMSAIALEAKHNLQSNGFTAILDKGYHNGMEIQACRDASIKTICAHSEVVNSNDKGTTPDYVVTKFTYNKKNDTYTCPQGHTLHTTGTWHTKTRERDSYKFRKFRTPKCKTCPVKHLCTGRADGRRELSEANHEYPKKNME
jgi:radical SAM protein with 4Fe4S-binding SPASM domain